MNIIKTLNKEIEKGNIYMDKQGNTLTLEKIEQLAKKDYLDSLKRSILDFSVPFDQYQTSFIEVNYIPVSAVAKVLEDTIKYGNEETYHCEEPSGHCCPPEEVLA